MRPPPRPRALNTQNIRQCYSRFAQSARSYYSTMIRGNRIQTKQDFSVSTVTETGNALCLKTPKSKVSKQIWPKPKQAVSDKLNININANRNENHHYILFTC